MNKKIVAVFSTLIMACVSAIGCSLAWFYTPSSIVTNEVNGGLIKSYFHSGNGTQENPFIITRPVHLYNFIALQEELDAFSSQGFYFQFGTDLNNDGSPEFYKYKDDGSIVEGEYSTSLNMSYYSDGLDPIGTVAHPFQSIFNGNGLTVSNLTIKGEGHMDVGIFGYVSSGTVTNLYFDSPTILTNGESTSAETADSTHVSHDETCCYNGYLVGHLKTASSFKDVYVNNCSLNGAPATGTIARNEYGYYGHVGDSDMTTKEKIADMDNGDGKGDDYSFHMKASDLYNFLNEQNEENSFSNCTMVTRNDPDSVAVTESDNLKVSTALSTGSSSFQLDGNYNDRSSSLTRNSTRYNYDFAKIGYASGEAKDYNLYYKNGSTYTAVPSDAQLTTYAPDYNPNAGKFIYYDSSKKGYVYYEVTSGYQEIIETTDCPLYYSDGQTKAALSGSIAVTTTDPDSCTSAGKYLYYTDGRWTYYECTSPASIDTRTKSVAISFDSGTIAVSTNSSSSATVSSAAASLYVDDSASAVATISLTNPTASAANKTITFTIPSGTFGAQNLQYGTHFVSIIVSIVYKTRGNNKTAYAYYGTNASNTLSGKEFVVDESTSESYSIGALLSNGTTSLSVSGTSFVPTNSNAVYTSSILYYQFENNYKTITDSSTSLFDLSSLKYSYTYTSSQTKATHSDKYLIYYDKDSSYNALIEEPTQLSDNSWVYEISGDVYLSDLFEDYIPSDSTTTTGYNSNNVDFIGFLNLSSTSIQMPGYTGDFYQLSDSSFGQKFYGNTANGASASVVTYVKNVTSKTGDMGIFEVYYSVTTEVVFARGSTSTPGSGSRGSSIVMPLEGASGLNGTTVTKTIDGTSRSGVKATVTTTNLENCAYCAIDASGNIIARAACDDGERTNTGSYYISGTGMHYQDGKSKNDVAYYVLIMSVTGGQYSSNNLYELDFEFKADDGSGDGDATKKINEDDPLFSNVDYRDSGATVTNSILNIQYDAAAGTTSEFCIIVSYDSSKYLYTITITNSNSSGLEFSVLLNDDDGDSTTDFLYKYSIIYNSSTIVTESQVSKTYSALPAVT